MKYPIQPPRRALLGVLLVLCAASCRSAEPDPTPSVNPGINEPYLAESIDVGSWVERFEREGRTVFDNRDEIVAAAHIPAGSVVADVGAGTGLFVPMLSRAVGPRGEVLAVDIVPDFLTHIDERAAAAGLENVRTVLCTERSIEVPSESIDVAFLCDVYHHFEYPADTLASIHRALLPGGTLAVVEFERIEGVSSDWLLEHVRAGKEVFLAEIESAGFELIEDVDLGMDDTFYLRFRKVRLQEAN